MGNFKAVNGMTNGSIGDLMGGFNFSLDSVKKTDQGNQITTNNIDEQVGKAYDKDIDISLLVKAKNEWNFIGESETSIFPEPSKDTIYRMAASIDKYGLLHRITVWEQPDGKYMILGGHTRSEAYRWLSENTHKPEYNKIPARVYRKDQISEDDAHRIFIVSNTDQRTLSASAIANAYMELLKLEKEHAFYGSGIYTIPAAAKQADVSPSTFNLYLSFTKLIPELQAAIDNQDLAVWPAYSLSRLSADLQKHVFTAHNKLCRNKSMSKDLGKELQKCEDVQSIDKLIDAWLNKPQTYTYRVSSHLKMNKDETALPIVVPKNMRQEVKKLIIDHVDILGLDSNAKERLISALTSSD